MEWQDRQAEDGEDSFACCELLRLFNAGNVMLLLSLSAFDFSLLNSSFV